jgi:imidazolonepropionase-like amidohydrolase
MPKRLAVSVLLGLGILLMSRSAPAQQDGRVWGPGKLAIVGGFLIDGNGGIPIENAVVLMEGDRIAHVGTVADTRVPDGFRVINARGYTVMPGLNDAHVHLMIVGHGIYDEYFPRYRNRLREVLPVSARELLLAGVTSARDLGAPLQDILWIKREIEAGRLPGPRLFVAGPFLQKSLPRAQGTSYDSSVQDFFRWTVNGADDARAKTRRLIEAGVDLIKVIQLDQLTPEERTAIATEARKAGKHIAVHAGTLEELRAAAEMGAGSVEHTGGGSKPLLDEEYVRIVVEKGIYYDPTSVVSKIYNITETFPARLDNQRLKTDLPADIYQDVRNSLNFFSRLNYFAGRNANRHHAAKIRQLWDQGARILVGTDSGTPMNFHYESTCQEMDLLVQYGLPPMYVIQAATKQPALLYGKGTELGTIEPGRLADIIVVDGNPLTHMSALRNVVHVIKGGVQYKGQAGIPESPRVSSSQ